MSGDSSDSNSFEWKEQESERGVAAPTAAAATSTPLPDENTNIIYQYIDKDNDEGAGDAKVEEDHYIENDSNEPSNQGSKDSPKSDKEEMDGVYVKRPPSSKVRSDASSSEDEDCASKCFYFTMKCCECSIM